MIKETYEAYKNWQELQEYIRSESCDIPREICDMFMTKDGMADELWQAIDQMPIVFSHRDYWVTNIFYVDGNIRLIDWDTTGWGYIGEDIASLVADETDPELMMDYYKRCVPAYIEGFSEYVDISELINGSKRNDLYIVEQIILFFGYRMLEDYKYAESEEEKAFIIKVLQKMKELDGIE